MEYTKSPKHSSTWGLQARVDIKCYLSCFTRFEGFPATRLLPADKKKGQ